MFPDSFSSNSGGDGYSGCASRREYAILSTTHVGVTLVIAQDGPLTSSLEADFSVPQTQAVSIRVKMMIGGSE